MFIRSEEVTASEIDGDICVIGAGAAGIAFSKEFLGSSVRVVVLESGEIIETKGLLAIEAYRFMYQMLGRFLNDATRTKIARKITSVFAHDSLYEVEYTDLPISHTSRRRAFGGTTTAWSGRWKRQDDIDFKKRPWVENSGWPFSRNTLDEYYRRASMSVHAPDLFREFKEGSFLQGTVFEPVRFSSQGKKSLNWGNLFKKQFADSKNISVYLDAHVVKIVTNGDSVERVEVRNSKGKSFTVSAKIFVLATGGIENARQLLLSHIGNEFDQVGRYFMDHPKAKFGKIKTKKPLNLGAYWNTSAENGFRVGFRLSDEIQEKEKILNSQVFIEPAYPSGLKNKILRKLGKTASNTFAVRNYLEQAPLPENRVVLSEQKDSLGLPKAKLMWTVSDIDKKTMVVFHQYLKDELQKKEIGSFESPLLNGGEFPPLEDASHHMGTTRMGEDPKTSVVDQNCKVHGVKNLFLAGSSVFPTSGHANPTALITALALRLADHVKETTT